MLFSPFPMFASPPAPTPVVVLTPTAPAFVAPIVYRQGAIMRDYLATEDRLDIDLTRPDAVYASDNVAIAQQVTILLGTFKGDRPDDATLGVDYAAIFSLQATNATRTSEFRRAIASVPGILAITRLSVTTNGGVCEVSWAATTYLGGITAGQTTVNGGA